MPLTQSPTVFKLITPPKPSADIATQKTAANTMQGELFGGTDPSPAELKLEELEPDEMTPKQALEALYQLKALTEPVN